MAQQVQRQPMNPVLQKPPGYKDPSKPVPRPLPRKAVLPPAFQPRKVRRTCCGRIWCIVYVSVAALLFLIGILGGIFIIWFDPKSPAFHVQSFKISTFDIATKTDGTYLNAATVARVEVRNPNPRLTYRYGVSEVEITVGKEQQTELGSTSLAGFIQAKKNTTSLKIATRVKNAVIEDGVGSRLKSHFKSRSMVVNLRAKTTVGLGVMKGLEIGMLGLDVLCDGITLKEIDGGNMPKCTIRTLKWINVN
ncbi:hypothetical protein JCGZ_14298 [Jatropha curcas]|uniref:Late embryogenesis abundant protein LEA-2 subgroup domain-containing protein n=1 Tax=Jatropha curcas TaxID=180498 RepID=A0A067JXB4_JATCU|nr:hypothetical protein JCGZ_14298 [Jatropha curcas]